MRLLSGLRPEPLDPARLADDDGAVLLDFQAPNAPLVISFGFYAAGSAATYDFYGRLRKLEALSGQPINKLLLRDPGKRWYHHGVPGVGNDAREAAARLRGLVQDLGPSSVSTLGQSMGAFGAILYGALMNVDQVIAFGTLARFDSRFMALCTDERWLSVVKDVEADPPRHFYPDLPHLLGSLDIRTIVHLVYGTKPADRSLATEAVNLDVVHALQLLASHKVMAYPLRWAQHTSAQFLREAGMLDEFLMNKLLGRVYAPEAFADLDIDPSWIQWLYANLEQGAQLPDLVRNMAESPGVSPEAAAECAARVLRNMLRRRL